MAEMMDGRAAVEADTERRRHVQCLQSSVIYSRKSALADNISSLSGGGGGGGSNPALGNRWFYWGEIISFDLKRGKLTN